MINSTIKRKNSFIFILVIVIALLNILHFLRKNDPDTLIYADPPTNNDYIKQSSSVLKDYLRYECSLLKR